MAKKSSDAHIRAVAKWQKANVTQVKINLHRINDADVLAKLEEVPSKAGYIKKLVREDIEKEQGK